jgi:Ca2+-binding RTX toxin-like protein
VPATLRSESGAYHVDAYQFERFDFTGGSGDDLFYTGAAVGAVDGGDGADFWQSDFSAVLQRIVFDVGSTGRIRAAGVTSIENLERIDMTTGAGNDRITGADYADRIITGAGNDRIETGSRALQADGSIDVVGGGGGEDTLVVDAAGAAAGLTVWFGFSPSIIVRSSDGSYAIDAYETELLNFSGGGGADSVSGGADRDVLVGRDGADTLAGGDGVDRLNGGRGADSLLGGDSQDTLDGGQDADVLTGGGGPDTFVFAGARETAREAPDRITDLGNSDVIDLSLIDANALVDGDQAFVFVAEFTGAAGEAVLKVKQGATTLSLNTDEDETVEAVILIDGRHGDFSNFVA